MPIELSDEEVFGVGQQVELSDAEVFGGMSQPVGLTTKQRQMQIAKQRQMQMQMTPMTPPEPQMIISDAMPLSSSGSLINVPRMDVSPAMPKLMQAYAGTVNAGAGLLEGLVSPMGVPAMVGGPITGTGKLIGALFGLDMARHVPQATEQFAETVYDPNASLGEKVESGVSLAALPAMAYAAGRPAVRAVANEMSIIRPEVLPPRGPYVAPVNRQLAAPERPFIETEFVDPLLAENNYHPRTEVAPVGGARFLGDEMGSVTPVVPELPNATREFLRNQPTYIPREQVVRPAQQAPMVIGGQVPQRQVFYEPARQEIQPVVVPSRPPVEESGGEISFRAPAEAEAIPSAGQSALPGSFPSTAKGMQTKLKPGQGGERGSIINPVQAVLDRFKNKEKQKRGDTFTLSGPQMAIDPKQSGFADPTKEVDAQQMYNRMRNKLEKSAPAEWEFYKDKLPKTGRTTPEKVAEIMQDSGPEVRVESYGMEGKVSEAKKELAELQHKHDSMNILDKQGNPTVEALAIEKRIEELGKQVADELADTSPHATSYYNSVSALDTTQPMPEWTTTKGDKNVQVVHIIAPTKDGKVLLKADGLHEQLDNSLGWAMIQYKTGKNGEKIAVVGEAQSRWEQEHRKQLDQIRIENKPAIFGDDTKPWAVSHQNRTSFGGSGERATSSFATEQEAQQYANVLKQKMSEATGHPLLRDYNRLILKAAIKQARKEGATRIVVSDAETAMMTERLDNNSSFRGPYGTKEQAESLANKDWKVFQHGDKWYLSNKQGGYAVNYGPTFIDKQGKVQESILPKIMEELTGGKGEWMELGEHKNAFKDRSGFGGIYKEGDRVQRDDLIFHKPDGTLKIHLSGLSFDITKQGEKKYSLFEKDKPAQREARLYGGVPFLDPALIKSTAKDAGGLVKETVNLYSEPMVERLGRLGGPVSKKVSQEARQIVSHAKKFYGELTPVVDAAKQASGKFMGAGTTWIRGVDKVNDKAAISKMVSAVEGTGPVPARAQDMVNKIKAANLAIGRLILDDKASGKVQRIWSSYGVDVLRRGRGPAWEAIAEGNAQANGRTVAEAKSLMLKLKQAMDAPGFDTAMVDKISQDFVRVFPKAITHIKPGSVWHEILVTDPFNYLEQAAQRTAHAKAFREVYKPGSGLLDATRKSVQKELETNKYEGEFDNLMKALQGHPVDQFTGWWTAPDTVPGAVGRMAGQMVMTPVKAMVLTGNALTNIAESLVGGPAIFLGAKNVGKGLIEMAKSPNFYKQMEMTGNVNNALMNWAFDPKSPARSVARIFSGGLHKVSLGQAFNELQEAQAGAAAKVVADRVKANDLLPSEKQDLIASMRVMGFTEADAFKAVNKADPELLSQFETMAAARLTGGNQRMGDKSQWGANRVFNELFWFTNYPQTVFNQFKGIIINLVKDVKNKNKDQARANAKLLGKFLGGKILQGALTTGFITLAYEGMSGLKERIQEAQEDLLKFAIASFFTSMNGPINLVQKGVETGGDSKALQLMMGSRIAPVNIGSELLDATIGNGRYEGLDAPERVGAFIESKTPGLKALKTGMALFELSQEDRELTTALKAFYRWRRSELGWRSEIKVGEDEGVEFRAQMRKAVKALENGQDWRKALPGDPKKASDSLYARTVLKTPDGKVLSEEQLEKLGKRIGTNLVEKLQTRDAMIREVARNLSETKDVTQVKEPTGIYAVDRETGTKRAGRVMESLSKETQEFLKRNQVEAPSYTPEIGPGAKKDLLKSDEGRKMEKEFVDQLELLLKSLQNPYFETLPKKVREQSISKQIKAARKMAGAKTRGSVLQD
jgi:hypothetical protein